MRTLSGILAAWRAGGRTSPDRSHQLLAGALVADAVMSIFDLEGLEICPWALREGIILERLDTISVIR